MDISIPPSPNSWLDLAVFRLPPTFVAPTCLAGSAPATERGELWMSGETPSQLFHPYRLFEVVERVKAFADMI